MSKYGSLQNLVYANARSEDADPKVGTGVTEIMYSDRHAYTVVEAPERFPVGARIVVQRDKATRTDKNGMSDAQSWRFEQDTEGPRVTLSLRKNGRWVPVGQGLNSGGRWLVGVRMEHYDFSF